MVEDVNVRCPDCESGLVVECDRELDIEYYIECSTCYGQGFVSVKNYAKRFLGVDVDEA